jgi:hypothetical protein
MEYIVNFTFDGDFNPEMEITKMKPPEVVEWRCAGGHEPWTGSTFRFALTDLDGRTRLRFRQHYAHELEDDYFGIYNFNWGYYLESLRLYCITGQGKPFIVTPKPVPQPG